MTNNNKGNIKLVHFKGKIDTGFMIMIIIMGVWVKEKKKKPKRWSLVEDNFGTKKGI